MKTVLLSGGTGAIGSVLARYFLEEERTQLRLLLRARSAAHLEERIRELERFWDGATRGGRADGRIQAMAGDVTLPRLGLEEASYRRLSSEVTHIVHSAGNVKLNQTLEEARRSSVDAARHIVALAEAARRDGSFVKVDVVSTVGVAGRTPGLIPERPFIESRQFRNTYEAAKAEAETFLLREQERGLPLTIHRPSMVIGDSSTGRIIQFQVFYHLCEFLSGKRTAGLIPDTGDVRLDVIPVDYVARAIQIATERPDSVGRILHLCSGPSHAPRIADLARQVHEVFALSGNRLRPLREIPSSWVRGALPLLTWLAPPRARKALRTLPYFLAYLDEPQTFDNANTIQFFASSGLEIPAMKACLVNALGYYCSHRKGA